MVDGSVRPADCPHLGPFGELLELEALHGPLVSVMFSCRDVLVQSTILEQMGRTEAQIEV